MAAQGRGAQLAMRHTRKVTGTADPGVATRGQKVHEGVGLPSVSALKPRGEKRVGLGLGTAHRASQTSPLILGSGVSQEEAELCAQKWGVMGVGVSSAGRWVGGCGPGPSAHERPQGWEQGALVHWRLPPPWLPAPPAEGPALGPAVMAPLTQLCWPRLPQPSWGTQGVSTAPWMSHCLCVPASRGDVELGGRGRAVGTFTCWMALAMPDREGGQPA